MSTGKNSSNAQQKVLYAIPFRDCSVSAFISADLYHYGYESDIRIFIEICKADGSIDEYVKAFEKWFRGKNTKVNVAYIDRPIATVVRFSEMAKAKAPVQQYGCFYIFYSQLINFCFF